MNDDSMVRGIITDTIKRCPKSRQQIAEEMSVLLNVSVTERMITSFTSESKELLELLSETTGLRAIGPDEERLIEIGRAFVERKRAEKLLKAAEL